MSVQGPSLDEVVAASVSRRHVMAGGTAALAAFLGLSAPAPAPAAARPEPKAEASGRLGFAAVPASTADTVTVPAGHSVQTLAPWGQPVRGHSPRWRADGGSGAAEQALQIGTHHSGVHFFPYDDGPRGNRHGTLVIGHEATDAALLFRDGGAEMTREKVAKSLAAQGLSVLEVLRRAMRLPRSPASRPGWARASTSPSLMRVGVGVEPRSGCSVTPLTTSPARPVQIGTWRRAVLVRASCRVHRPVSHRSAQ
ncbi:alkaline phosphatase PhoX [Streptomyces sp. PTD9-10]|uniref:alkaline phosphatase PhoX n=1 Tax=Streptomyces sp. PTD9-10 TaxID=3120151 RepID=UPI003007F35B